MPKFKNVATSIFTVASASAILALVSYAFFGLAERELKFRDTYIGAVENARGTNEGVMHVTFKNGMTLSCNAKGYMQDLQDSGKTLKEELNGKNVRLTIVRGRVESVLVENLATAVDKAVQ